MQAARGTSLNLGDSSSGDSSSRRSSSRDSDRRAPDSAGSYAGDAHGPAGAATAAEAPTRPRRVRTFALAAAVVYALDVLSKVLAVELLSDRSPVDLVPGVLQLTLVRNPGAAFSLGAELTVVLTGIAVVVVVAVVRMAARLRDRGWALALGLLLGGALGNLTDRLLRQPGPLRGHVVDFLQLPNWPVFNLADSAIVVAAALVAWRSIRGIGLDGRRDR